MNIDITEKSMRFVETSTEDLLKILEQVTTHLSIAESAIFLQVNQKKSCKSF